MKTTTVQLQYRYGYAQIPVYTSLWSVDDDAASRLSARRCRFGCFDNISKERYKVSVSRILQIIRFRNTGHLELRRVALTAATYSTTVRTVDGYSRNMSSRLQPIFSWGVSVSKKKTIAQQQNDRQIIPPRHNCFDSHFSKPFQQVQSFSCRSIATKTCSAPSLRLLFLLAAPSADHATWRDAIVRENSNRKDRHSGGGRR